MNMKLLIFTLVTLFQLAQTSPLSPISHIASPKGATSPYSGEQGPNWPITRVSLTQLSERDPQRRPCNINIGMRGIYTPGNGHMTVNVGQHNKPVCELNEFISGKRDPYWLNCVDGKYSWISQDAKRFAYAADGVDYHGIPEWTPLYDADNNQALYFTVC